MLSCLLGKYFYKDKNFEKTKSDCNFRKRSLPLN